MVKKDTTTPSTPEWILVLYIVSFTFEEIRQVSFLTHVFVKCLKLVNVLKNFFQNKSNTFFKIKGYSR